MRRRRPSADAAVQGEPATRSWRCAVFGHRLRLALVVEAHAALQEAFALNPEMRERVVSAQVLCLRCNKPFELVDAEVDRYGFVTRRLDG